MKKTFKKRQGSFFLRLTVFSLVLYGLHSLLISYFYADTLLFYPLWLIYLFHFVMVFFIYTTINLRNTGGVKKIFRTFMTFTILKMALAIVFLLPLLLSGREDKQTDVVNFFIPYFLFLAAEVYYIVSFLRKA